MAGIVAATVHACRLGGQWKAKKQNRGRSGLLTFSGEPLSVDTR